MGQIGITGSGGGITSDDVTAKAEDVLQGKKTVTADSNDEVISGTMPLITTDNFDVEWHMMAYNRSDSIGQGKAVDSPKYGRGITVSIKPPDAKKYALDEKAHMVFKPEPHLQPYNIRSGVNIAGVQGGIPEWGLATSGGLNDVLYAPGDQGMMYDLANGLHGIMTKIPDGHIIKQANWVFLKSDNLRPHNVKTGVDINGCHGTLNWIEKKNDQVIGTHNVEFTTSYKDLYLDDPYKTFNCVFIALDIRGDVRGFRHDKGNGWVTCNNLSVPLHSDDYCVVVPTTGGILEFNLRRDGNLVKVTYRADVACTYTFKFLVTGVSSLSPHG